MPKRPDIAHARRILKNPGEEGNGIYLPVSLGNRRPKKRVKFGYPEAPQA